MTLRTSILRRLERVKYGRPPDVIIGGHADPYLLRWYLIPRNPVFNVYLHQFLRSDDDRALHDHPWINASLLLDGSYTEHTIAAGGIHHRTVRQAGDIVLRGPKAAHRIELHAGPCTTLFITGPRVRPWYFHCPERGLVHWRDFTDPRDSGSTGRGCDE